MKPRFALLALAAASAPLVSAVFSAPTSVSSQITAVTVYLDRAIVTRTAHVDLAPGQSELSFEKLPDGLLDQSLQVSGQGTAAATILDVTARTTYVETTPDARIKTVEDEITDAQKKLRALNDRAAVLDQQRALLAKIEAAVTAPPGKDGTAPRPSFDEWQKLLTFADENRSKLAAEQQTLDPQREEIQAKINALSAQLNDLRGRAGGGRSYKTVVVRVASNVSGGLDLALAYTVPGASWVPLYDARLRTEERAVELTYFGSVRQNTGEDWRDVALTLSTARPSLGGGAPELSPWFVDVMRPMPSEAMETVRLDSFSVSAKAVRERQTFNQAAAADATRGFGGLEKKDAELAQATIEAGLTSASFKISTPATVLSDNTPQKVGITTAKLAANLQYQATPRAQETAFLSAYVTNTTDFPLLAGAMNTFLGDAFVASSALKTVMAGERFELALGADDGIAIKRKAVNRFSEETGLTNSGRRVTYEFLVTVTNNKKTAEHVVFKDIVPISRNEKIAVKLLSPAERDLGTADKPKEVSREADGKLVWRLDLKPGEKREIPLKFSVDYPADIQVSGLE